MKKDKKDKLEENRLMQLYLSKQSFLEKYWADDQIAILKQWQDNCKNFCDFEELYVIVQSDLIPKDFYFDWFNSTKIYKEKMQVYSCTLKEIGLWPGQELIRNWINKLWSDPDSTKNERNQADLLVYRDDEKFEKELEKILKL